MNKNLFKELIKGRDAILNSPWHTTYYPREAEVYLRGQHPFWESIDKELSARQSVSSVRPSIFVVGYGSSEFLNSHNQWRASLANWTKNRNAQVYYLPLDLDSGAEDILAEISKGCGDALQVCKVRKKSPAHIRRLADAWKESSFIFSDNPKFLWVEGRAPKPGRVTDYSAFFSSDACRIADLDWRIYNDGIVSIKQHLIPLR